MSDKDLIKALRGIAVETGSLVCQGCGHEHSCREYGCAVINKAAARLQVLTEPPNDPLTMDELKNMIGEPVWVIIRTNVEFGSWRVIRMYREEWDAMLFQGAALMPSKEYGKSWLAYRCKPEECSR